MRRYNLVSGIILIISVINVSLAAPVLVQEKHQASVDVVHIPRDVITASGKRGGEEVEKLAEEFSKMLGKPVDSQGAHASELSSSAPLGLDHESTNEGHVPAPNPKPSEDPDTYSVLTEELPPSQRPKLASWKEFSQAGEGQVERVQLRKSQSNPELSNPKPSPQYPNSYWDQVMAEKPPSRKRPKPASLKEFGQTDEGQVERVQLPKSQSNPELSNPSPLQDPNSYWDEEELPPTKRPKLATSKEFGRTDENKMEQEQLPSPPSNPAERSLDQEE